MSFIRQHVNLQSLNTFGIEAFCDFYTEINTIEDFQKLLQTEEYRNHEKLILGGGSNVLFTKDFKGLVIKNQLKGIGIVAEQNDEVLVKAAAGENWHGFVEWCLANGLNGIENLSLIPGCVGASPMQNIGAYGVEIKDVFEQLEACSMEDGQLAVFTKDACDFGYRESVFKRRLKNKYFITSVTFRLSKTPKLNTAYGAIQSELETMGIKSPGAKEISEAVMRIRRSKLPDPKVMGNAGSFFKNPEVTADTYKKLLEQFPKIVAYALPNGNYKLAAGWLIEQCALKGFEHYGAAVHQLQALVLVNKNKASGNAVFELSTMVMKKVFDTFGVTLEREVNIV